ncbi:hypothetical protein LTR41_011024 [Exophiala xenobiotica]|nr:hypothetical protein LTR41_011024 [Exophiala xenobiotica]
MADQIAFFDDGEPRNPLFQRGWSLALAPVRILTSRTAIKAYLSTILFLVTSTILLTISSTTFGFFYYKYIPQINLERVLYLQYGPEQHPYATTALDTSALISQQAYDVELVLDMPRTPTNLEAGNFMLDLSLLGPGINVRNVLDPLSAWLSNITTDNVYKHSRRPAILPYSSPILSLSHTLLHLPWHAIGWRDLDAVHLVVPMFEMISFPRGSRNVPSHARLELQSSSIMQVYNAKLAFRAKFQGLRYWIYNYRVVAFVIFTALFYTISITSMGLAWAAITVIWAKRDASEERKRIKQEDPAGAIKQEGDAGEKPKVKEEAETESSTHGLSLSNVSDTAAQFPSRPGQMPLRFPGRPATDTAPDEAGEHLTQPLGPDEAADDEDEEDGAEEVRGRPFEGDSGIGTSMESEHRGLGVVRKRSSRGLSSR